MSPRLWSRYALAKHTFELDPSPLNEGAVIAAYSEWVRQFEPDDADDLISLMIRNLARQIEDRKAA